MILGPVATEWKIWVENLAFTLESEVPSPKSVSKLFFSRLLLYFYIKWNKPSSEVFKVNKTTYNFYLMQILRCLTKKNWVKCVLDVLSIFFGKSKEIIWQFNRRKIILMKNYKWLINRELSSKPKKGYLKIPLCRKTSFLNQNSATLNSTALHKRWQLDEHAVVLLGEVAPS